MTKPATFQSLLDTANLPPPGPEHFAARRALWTTPTAASRLDQSKQDHKPGVLESSEVSDTAFVPLCTVIKVVHAGWRRDGTWPDNAAVVDEDNFFGTMDSHGIDPSAGVARKSEGG
ncbi:hypothetical protein EI94DRAFT_299342 [Lactarius quietus]|nr:hypothetical protein EI94DRAFT_299342 [Lactarius quietus]